MDFNPQGLDPIGMSISTLRVASASDSSVRNVQLPLSKCERGGAGDGSNCLANPFSHHFTTRKWSLLVRNIFYASIRI
jgi:hypothetical protein